MRRKKSRVFKEMMQWGTHAVMFFMPTFANKPVRFEELLKQNAPLSMQPLTSSTIMGRKIPIRLSTAILKDEQGNIVGGVETFQDLSQIEALQKELENKYSFEDIVGRSSQMTQLFKVLPQIAESSSTVLIEGPSGTGKELFAQAIHNLSPRRDKPFVAINCAALPDNLLESELFGYKAGAFTDARRDKRGLIHDRSWRNNFPG